MQMELKDIRKHFDEAENILITAHIHPDGDAVGSCLALYHVLKQMGKKARVVLDKYTYSERFAVYLIKRMGKLYTYYENDFIIRDSYSRKYKDMTGRL